jgi:hypothetical protein
VLPLLLACVQATNINMNILWTAASLVLTRCFAVYTQAQTQRTMMQQQMTSSLYDKMQDSQEGVISVITEVGITHHSHLTQALFEQHVTQINLRLHNNTSAVAQQIQAAKTELHSIHKGEKRPSVAELCVLRAVPC